MPIIKSINGSELVDLILKYYDLMSEEFKDTIKLRKVFIPVVEENEGQFLNRININEKYIEKQDN